MQPDLVIWLANGPLVNALDGVGIFVETKVVSMKRSLSSYTKDGVSRFVRGDYAWAMQDGLMIAYRTKPHRKLETLESSLGKDRALLVAQENKKNLVQSGLTIPASGKVRVPTIEIGPIERVVSPGACEYGTSGALTSGKSKASSEPLHLFCECVQTRGIQLKRHKHTVICQSTYDSPYTGFSQSRAVAMPRLERPNVPQFAQSDGRLRSRYNSLVSSRTLWGSNLYPTRAPNEDTSQDLGAQQDS